MQEQIAVDALDGAEVRRVAIGAADLRQQLFAGLDAAARIRIVRHALYGPVERGHECRHLFALLLSQVEPAGHVGGLSDRPRLVLSGIA